MRYSTIVEKNENTLSQLIQEVEAFDQEHVLNGLEARSFTEEDVMMLTAHVMEQRGKLDKEIISLKNFSKTFIQQYATTNNTCFDTATKLFNRMRSGIAGTKKMYRTFCKRNMRPGPVVDGEEQKVSAFSHSQLYSQIQEKRLFGSDGYLDCVTNLCKEMELFFDDLCAGLQLCIGILRKENMIRHDFVLANRVYESCCQQEIENGKLIIDFLSSTNCPDDELTKHKEQAKSLQEFICGGYHFYSKENFHKHAIIQAVKKGKRNGLTQLEALLWQEDADFVKQVRNVIHHFDSLEPKGYKDNASGKYKLSAKCVAMFMEWAKITASGKEKQFVEEYFNKEYNGKYKCVSATSVNNAKKNYSKEEYSAFCDKVNDCLDTYSKTSFVNMSPVWGQQSC